MSESGHQDGLTAEILRDILDYDPGTGLFTRKITRSIRWKAGQVAGSHNASGYITIGIDRTHYYAHRLAWLYMTGSWPQVHIDHRDRDKTNNAWSNLRAASRSQNLHNVTKRKHNTSGYKGVSFYRRHKKFAAQIKCGATRKFLGYYETAEEAHAAYCRAAVEMNGEFARL